MDRKMLPIGVDVFEKIRKVNYYYVDKTDLIRELLSNRGGSESVYAPAAFWKKSEYEYAQVFF